MVGAQRAETMNLVLLFPEDFIEKNRVRLTDERALHIESIHRGYSGRELKVGLALGGIGRGKIISMEEGCVEMDVSIPNEKPQAPSVSLLIALPRPQSLKKILETASCFGVRRMDFVGAEKVEKSFFQSSLLKDKAWFRHVRLGLEQGGHTWVPEVNMHRSLKWFLSEHADHLSHQLKLILHPYVPTTLWDTDVSKAHPTEGVVCTIGPEGGWQDTEVELFVSKGFQPISLNTPVLRVENAVCAALSQMLLLQKKSKRE